MSRRTPLVRYAVELGFSLTAGSKHWHGRHPGGGWAIVPFGSNLSDRSVRNVQASLRRAARGRGLGGGV